MREPATLPKRRLRLFVLLALGAIALYAFLGFFLVPWIAKGQIVKQSRALLGREAAVERIRCNPFTLAAEIEGFRLADRDGEPLASFDRLEVDFEIGGIFRRAWRFDTISLEHPVVSARILEDGRISVADLLEKPPTETAEEEEGGVPRLIVDHLLVSGGRIAFTDRSRSPVFSTALEPLNLDVRDLVTIPGEEGDHALRIGIGEGTELRWQGRQSLSPLQLAGRVETEGLHLARWWAYFGAGLPLDLTSGRGDASLTYDVNQADDGSFVVRLTDAAVEARDLALRPRNGEEDWLTVGKMRAENVRLAWPESKVEIEAVRVERPRAVARLGEDGALDWVTLFDGEMPPSEADAAPARPWTFEVASFDLAEGESRFEDRSVEPGVTVEVTDLAVAMKGLSSDLARRVAFDARARVNGSAEIAAAGGVSPAPFAVDLDVRLSALDVLPFRPYAALFPGARLTSAIAGAHGKLSVSGEPVAFRYEGTASLSDLELLDPDEKRLLAWRALDASGVRVSGMPLTVRVRKIAVEAPYANLFIDREGKLNLAKLAAAPGETAPSGGEPLDLEIVAVDLLDATVDFTDESLILPFGTKIHSAKAEIRDLSTKGAAPAILAFEGRIDETGYAKASGTSRPADLTASTDVAVEFRDVEMKRLTPYSAEFAGYALERGSLDVDIRYRIEDRRLVGTHQVVAKDLVLGERIKGSSVATLPVRLAVALLKDKDGRIDLEVPIEGDVGSPEFAYRKVIWQAVKKILVNIAAAPFRAIGRLFGSDDEDLELVEFDPGRSRLLPVEQDKLARLAEEIAKKPELVLEVEGRYAPEADTAALRRQKLDESLEARRAEAAEGTADGATMDRILETLFAERFGAEALEAERAAFPDPPAFCESLRAKLLAAQPVSGEDLEALARARAESIVAGLTAAGALEAGRVAIKDPVEAKRKKKGSDRIASELSMEAGDE
jgi:hypothetical protein